MAEYWVAAGNDLSEGTVVGARQWAVGNNGGYFAVTRRCRAPAPQTSPIRGGPVTHDEVTEALRATHGEQVHVHAVLQHRPMINDGSDMTAYSEFSIRIS
jgi:hypothetical protein